MILVFGDFVQYFEYPFHILGLETLGEHYVPWTRFLDWTTLVNLNVFKGYQNLLNLLNTLCIYVISQVYSQVGNNPLFPVQRHQVYTVMQVNIWDVDYILEWEPYIWVREHSYKLGVTEMQDVWCIQWEAHNQHINRVRTWKDAWGFTIMGEDRIGVWSSSSWM